MGQLVAKHNRRRRQTEGAGKLAGGDDVSVRNLFVLPAGRCKVAAWMLDLRLQGTAQGRNTVDLPVWMYVLDTTDGLIVVDTGMPDECVGHPDVFTEPGEPAEIVPFMTDADKAASVLARTGYLESELKCIVCTHGHFDHAGGLRSFPKTEVVIQSAEYDALFAHSPRPATEEGDADSFGKTEGAFWLPSGLRYRLVDGDVELVPGVRLIATPGHSPGHQSLLLDTERSGPVLLTIDAAYTAANYESGVPFAAADVSQARSSTEKLRRIATEQSALVFYGHDIEQETQVRRFPQSY